MVGRAYSIPKDLNDNSCMKVLLTGAAGRLGRAIVREATRKNLPIEFVRVDSRPAEDSLCVDVSDLKGIAELVKGCDAIIHTAGLHSHDLQTSTRCDFFRINVEATDNLLHAAVKNEVQRFIFSSTCQVYGHHWDVMGIRRLSPETPVNPTTIYPLTKWLGEQICEQYHRQYGLGIACLRYSNFNDGPWERYGTELCARSIWDGDAAQANLNALTVEDLGFGQYVIGPETRLQEQDLDLGATDPAAVLERRWPGSVAKLRDAGYEIKPHLFPLLDITLAQRELGYRPEKTFDLLLQTLTRAA